MGDPTPEIEIELGRPIVTQQQANDHRKKLFASFAKLSQDQAAALLDRLLKLDGSAPAFKFPPPSSGQPPRPPQSAYNATGNANIRGFPQLAHGGR